MAGEELLKLFERNWSERPIFKKDKTPLNLNEKSQEKRGEQEIPEKKEEEYVKEFPVSFLVERAMSDETMMTSSKTSLFGSSSDDMFLSPTSVLPVKPTPMKLQTILSGKEVREFSSVERDRLLSYDLEKEEQRRKKKSNVRTRRGKSMTDLEYEELKGFMDLGFVFSEEDHKDSNLVSIIPGLQRLVKAEDEQEEEKKDKKSGNKLARPYLSEAWEHYGRGKGKRQSLPEIKLSVLTTTENEVDLKDHLKLWAHAVASTIRR